MREKKETNKKARRSYRVDNGAGRQKGSTPHRLSHAVLAPVHNRSFQKAVSCIDGRFQIVRSVLTIVPGAWKASSETPGLLSVTPESASPLQCHLLWAQNTKGPNIQRKLMALRPTQSVRPQPHRVSCPWAKVIGLFLVSVAEGPRDFHSTVTYKARSQLPSEPSPPGPPGSPCVIAMRNQNQDLLWWLGMSHQGPGPGHNS